MPFKVKGIGIDLVSVPRVRKILKHHRAKTLKRLLTPSERKHFSRKSLSPAAFAKLFAAKEAFFKAVGRSWMGLEGFGAIEIKGFPRGRFQAKSSAYSGPWRAEGRFFGTRELAGAQVILWDA